MNFDINKLKESTNLALFLGMLAGDGCLPVSHNGEGFRIYPIRFYNTDKNMVELFHKLFLNLFGISGSIRGRERKHKQVLWEFEKYSVKLYKLITTEFEIACGKKASKVSIPSFILEGNNELKRHFLLGFFITDGGLRSDGSIVFHIASKKMAQDIQKITRDMWGFRRPVKKYTQKGIYISYQINLKKDQSSKVLQDMLRSHNSVLRRLSKR